MRIAVKGTGMYVDLWGWFHDSEHQAQSSGDHDRLQFNQIAYRGWRYRRTAQPDIAFQVFDEGVALAQRLHEPCWELFFQYWCSEMLFYHKTDQQAALDYAIRIAARAYQERYLHCPIRSRIYFVLADIYYAIDFFSYQDNIRQMLDYLDNEVPMDHDTVLRVRHMRAEFEMEFERYDTAKSLVMGYMPDAEGNDFRMRSAYNILRRIAYAQGDIVLALEYANHCESYAIQTQSQSALAAQKLSQAVYHKRLGAEAEARRLYMNAIELYDRYGLPRWPSFYSSVCEYLELNNESEAALALCQKQIDEMTTHNSIYNESCAHLDYCRLLGRLNRPLDTALAAAHALSARMTQPDLYLQRLKRIEDGNYYEFDWQKNR